MMAAPLLEEIRAIVARHGASLHRLARETLAAHLKGFPAPSPSQLLASEFVFKVGCFVTLKKRGQLRGCIGHLEPRLPLLAAVQEMTLAAALEDPRFPPLEPAELPLIELEISILTPLQKISGNPLESIQIGLHGVHLRCSGRSSVFLPEVALEQEWDVATLLRELSAKAGMDGESWRRGEISLFESLKIKG